MQLENHLIYIDITQKCDIGCHFCMYSEKHVVKEHLSLSLKARENISRLINHSEISKVVISGEGEPLNNINAFKEILHLSQGNISFEFITSGYLPHNKLFDFYKEIDEIIQINNDTCNIRLSTDSYHLKKINNKPHGISLKHYLENKFNNLTFSFRSIDTDKEFTRHYLREELKKFNIKSSLEVNDELEDTLTVDNKKFKIEYKNLVNPTFLNNEKYMDLKEYIHLKERKSGKHFTLGNITKKPLLNGMGITIKPSGDVFFYGIDNILLANVHIQSIDIDFFKLIVKKNNFIQKLYKKPFLKIMEEISVNQEIKSLIERVNNPYWIIKELMIDNKDIIESIEKVND